MSAQPKVHALYRFYGQGGELLYIGITVNPGNRWTDHSKEKPWWHEVIGITVEKHHSRAAVLTAERAAIHAERPKYNIQHNPRRPLPITRITTPPKPRRPAVRVPITAADYAHREATENAEWIRRGKLVLAQQLTDHTP